MIELKQNEEACERCGKVDVLEKMTVGKDVAGEDTVLCEKCASTLEAKADIAAEDYEPLDDTIV